MSIFDTIKSPTSTGDFTKGFGQVGAPETDLNSPQGLLYLASQQGGSVSSAAQELVHPSTGILSTIGNGFKNAFKEFVDVISVPSEVVAGVLSPNLTVGQAISQHTAVSDVVFGKKDPKASIYQKTGSFLLRTAVDILTDPLTYVTFGSGIGFAGLRAGSRVALQKTAAEFIGKEAGAVAHLSSEGQEVFNFMKKTERQLSGSTAAEIVKTGDTTLDMAGDELKKLMSMTLDAPLRDNYAIKAMSNLLEVKPALAETLLDKGGVKVFGKTILSGQRINSTMKLIPGMTLLDHLTAQPRLAISSLVDPTVVKAGKEWVRLPGEYVDMHQKWADIAGARADGKMRSLDDIVKEFKLSETEGRFLMAAVEHKMLPQDARLAGAFKASIGYTDQDWADLVANGLLSKEVRMEGWAPHMLVDNRVGSVAWKMPPTTKSGAEQLRKIARYVSDTTGEEVVGHADALGLTANKEVKDQFIGAAGQTYTRVPEPIHNIKGEDQFKELEGTLLHDPKKAAQMLDEMRQSGFEIFDDNFITAMAARSLKNSKAVSMKNFLQDLAQSFGHDAAVADSRYQTISSKGVKDASDELINIMGKEGELLFHPAIAAHVEKYMGSVINDDATMEFLKAFDSIQNMWKATVTSIWPAFHGRNAISNVLNNFLDLGTQVLNPQLHTVSMQMIKADRQLTRLATSMVGDGAKSTAAKAEFDALSRKVAFKDATGYDWTMGELRQVAKNSNIAFTSRIVTSGDVMGGPDKIAKALFHDSTLVGKGKSAVSAPFRFGQDVVGRTIEEQARLVNFIANLKNTGDVTLAARRTKQFLFDYSNLTNFERTFMKRLMPFYTFTRKNLELQARALMTTPGRIAAEIHAINTLGEVISGGDNLTDEERSVLPDWIKSGVSILTKKNGDQINLIANLGTPLESVFQTMQSNVLLGSISPLIRLPLEQAAGYSFFQGKPLSEVTNASAFTRAPKFLKDMIGYTEVTGKRTDGTPFTWSVALHPEMMNLILNLPPTTRVYTALKQMDAVDISGQAKIFQQITGVRPYSFDLAQEQQKRQNEMKTKLEDLLTKAGITAQFSTTYVPKDKGGFNTPLK